MASDAPVERLRGTLCQVDSDHHENPYIGRGVTHTHSHEQLCKDQVMIMILLIIYTALEINLHIRAQSPSAILVQQESPGEQNPAWPQVNRKTCSVQVTWK